MGDYTEFDKPAIFYTVVDAARRRGQTAIGYRLEAKMGYAAKSYSVHTNPKKSEPVSFSPADKVIALAEE